MKRGPKPTELVYVFKGKYAEKECSVTLGEVVRTLGGTYEQHRGRILALDPIRTYERVPVRAPRAFREPRPDHEHKSLRL